MSTLSTLQKTTFLSLLHATHSSTSLNLSLNIIIIVLIIMTVNQALVAHAYDPSFSGGREQDRSQSRQIVHEILPQKYLTQKMAGGVVQGVGPEFKPQYHKKNQ
jgi:Na+-translocating ferredoxin:NAD+ oxidoreductase RnfG subunit